MKEPLFLNKFKNRVCHIFQLFVGELGVDRECHDVVAEILADREVALFVARVGVGLLQMERHRIVDRVCDALRLQMSHEAGAVNVFQDNDILMIYMVGESRMHRRICAQPQRDDTKDCGEIKKAVIRPNLTGRIAKFMQSARFCL